MAHDKKSYAFIQLTLGGRYVPVSALMCDNFGLSLGQPKAYLVLKVVITNDFKSSDWQYLNQQPKVIILTTQGSHNQCHDLRLSSCNLGSEGIRFDYLRSSQWRPRSSPWWPKVVNFGLVSVWRCFAARQETSGIQITMYLARRYWWSSITIHFSLSSQNQY